MRYPLWNAFKWCTFVPSASGYAFNVSLFSVPLMFFARFSDDYLFHWYTQFKFSCSRSALSISSQPLSSQSKQHMCSWSSSGSVPPPLLYSIFILALHDGRGSAPHISLSVLLHVILLNLHLIEHPPLLYKIVINLLFIWKSTLFTSFL